jgi:hypothetical protein
VSEPIDDKALEEYLKGGSAVSQRYREIGADEVPDAVNRHILEQARAAVRKRPAKSRTWMRWSAPVALAASAVLVLSIVIDSGVQQDVVLAPNAPQPAADVVAEKREIERGGGANVPAETASASIESTEALQQAAPPSPAPVAESAAAIAQRKSARRLYDKKIEGAASGEALRERAPAAYPSNPQFAAPPPAETAAMEARAEPQPTSPPTAVQQSAATARQKTAPNSIEEVVMTGDHRHDADARRVGPRGTVRASDADMSSDMSTAEAEADTDTDSGARRAYSDPERWLKDIRQLRKDGKTAQADREWERFLAAFPDHPVAATDLAKKQ